MAFRYSVKLRNAGIDARIAAIGPDATLRIYATSQSSATKRELVSMSLGTDWMQKAQDGVATNARPWAGHGKAKGMAKSFCICDASGEVGISGAIPDELKLDNPDIAAEQLVTVSVFTIIGGNG